MNWEIIQKYLNIPSDGIPGIQTALQVAKALNIPQHDWKSIQLAIGVPADGIPGSKTAEAIALKLGIKELFKWPTQEEVRSNTSIFGAPGNKIPLVSVTLPYAMKLSWDSSSSITKISCHKLVAEAVRLIFEETYNHYGEEQIERLGLDLYGGCFNDRSIVGGTSKSMHSWGIAIDLDPDHNGLNTHSPKARFSAGEYVAFWEIVEDQGGVSLGRLRDYGWMHFQFARL